MNIIVKADKPEEPADLWRGPGRCGSRRVRTLARGGGALPPSGRRPGGRKGRDPDTGLQQDTEPDGRCAEHDVGTVERAIGKAGPGADAAAMDVSDRNAGNDVRRAEQYTLDRARAGFAEVTQELSARLSSARQADRQQEWLMWTIQALRRFFTSSTPTSSARRRRSPTVP